MTSPRSNRAMPAGAVRVGEPAWGPAGLTAADRQRHPRIPPWLRPIARRSGEIQFGVSPGGSIVTGMTEAEADLLTHLDGSLSIDASYRLAAEAGIPARRWRALLDLVDDVGVLEHSDEHDVAPAVILDGRGDLVDEVSLALRRGGIGTMVKADPSLPASTATDPGQPVPPLAIILGPTALDPRSGDPWLRQGVTHLPVVSNGPRAAVGPLVSAGLRGPCLWCLDLHRTDRDASWPALVAQVCGSPGDIVPREAALAEADPALAQIVAGCVALLVRGHLAGSAGAVGVSVEISLPWPRMDHRRWPIHPHCRRGHPTGV